jgi:hypothetical protein
LGGDFVLVAQPVEDQHPVFYFVSEPDGSSDELPQAGPHEHEGLASLSLNCFGSDV